MYTQRARIYAQTRQAQSPQFGPAQEVVVPSHSGAELATTIRVVSQMLDWQPSWRGWLACVYMKSTRPQLKDLACCTHRPVQAIVCGLQSMLGESNFELAICVAACGWSVHRGSSCSCAGFHASPGMPSPQMKTTSSEGKLCFLTRISQNLTSQDARSFCSRVGKTIRETTIWTVAMIWEASTRLMHEQKGQQPQKPLATERLVIKPQYYQLRASREQDLGEFLH